MAVAQCYKLFTLFTLFSLFIPFKLLYTAQTVAFMIGPFSSCEIGKTRGTNKQVNKQTNKNWNLQFPQPDLEPRHSNEQVLFYTFCGEVLPLLKNLNFLRYIKWGKALYKMRKRENTTFQWPKVSRLLTTLPRCRPDFRTGLRFWFRAPEVPVLRKSHFHWFSSLQKSHFRCPKRKSKTCSEIRSVTG